MLSQLYSDASKLIRAALQAAQPRTAVAESLQSLRQPNGRLLLVAVGKAAWEMAQAAYDAPHLHFDGGIVITKHGHARGQIGNLLICEAGHPVPDASTFRATAQALALTENLTADDTVLFCLSGGASALFEQPSVSAEELADITSQLLACGADIVEINTIRKRLSDVKGGRFALHCAPAQVFSVLLSDVIGDRADMIGSGPCSPDASTSAEALSIAKRYGLTLSNRAQNCLLRETPKQLDNVQTFIGGSVRQMCDAAEKLCTSMGYETVFLTDRMVCEAREAGSFFASIACSRQHPPRPLAFFAGGETVVHLRGDGLGGRNQELALAAAIGMDGVENALLFSLGSDGTDGPTDAAGGIVHGQTAASMKEHGVDPLAALENNDAYHALQAADGLLKTGPTGTNVNDLTVLLLR